MTRAVCLRRVDAARVDDLPGIELVACSICSAECIRAPSTPKELEIVCTRCLAREIEREGGSYAVAPATEEQLAEIAGFFAKGKA